LFIVGYDLSPKVERNIVIIGPLQAATCHNIPATDNPIPQLLACSSQNTHFKRCNKHNSKLTAELHYDNISLQLAPTSKLKKRRNKTKKYCNTYLKGSRDLEEVLKYYSYA
jgi:hypothetical protein